MIQDLRLWAAACAVAIIVAVVVFPERIFGLRSAPDAPSATPRSDPVETRVGGEARVFRVDAMHAYGATPWDEICPNSAAPAGGDVMRLLACGDGKSGEASPAAAAGFRLTEATHLSGEERERAARDAVAAGLRDLDRRERPKSDDWRGLAAAWLTLAEAMNEPKLFDVAGEAALVHAGLCDRAVDKTCASATLETVGEKLVETGRTSNSLERLALAADLLGQAVDALPADHDAERRASLIEELGSAYTYASHFETGDGSVRWLDRAVEAGERNLAYADAHAPSFTSARIWANLGSSYGARGGAATSSDDFRRALVYYEKALTFFKREEDPEAWAKTTENYASARSSLGTVERDLAQHDRAVADFEASAAVFDAEENPFDAAYVRYRLGKALGARADPALSIKRARAPKDPEPARLDEIARDSLKKGLAAFDAAEPALREAGSAAYLAQLESERRRLRGVEDGLGAKTE